MNRDEVTMALYQNLDVDVLVTAKRNGSLLSYLNGIVERIIPTTQNDYRPGRREDAVETRSNPNTVRPPTSQPERTGDSIRVSRL